MIGKVWSLCCLYVIIFHFVNCAIFYRKFNLGIFLDSTFLPFQFLERGIVIGFVPKTLYTWRKCFLNKIYSTWDSLLTAEFRNESPWQPSFFHETQLSAAILLPDPGHFPLLFRLCTFIVEKFWTKFRPGMLIDNQHMSRLCLSQILLKVHEEYQGFSLGTFHKINVYKSLNLKDASSKPLRFFYAIFGEISLPFLSLLVANTRL